MYIQSICIAKAFHKKIIYIYNADKIHDQRECDIQMLGEQKKCCWLCLFIALYAIKMKMCVRSHTSAIRIFMDSNYFVRAECLSSAMVQCIEYYADAAASTACGIILAIFATTTKNNSSSSAYTMSMARICMIIWAHRQRPCLCESATEAFVPTC